MSCDHDDCGVLCDQSILAERLALRQAGGRARSLTVEHVRAEGLLPIRLERAEQMLRAGMHTRHAIATMTGLSSQSVGRLATALGVVPVERVQTDEHQTSRMVELREQGWSVRQIANEVGCSKSAVSRRVSHLRQGRQGELVGSGA